MKITREIRFDDYVTLANLLKKCPQGVPHNKLRVDYKGAWEYGAETHYLVLAWEDDETENERKIRERESALQKEQVKQRELETLERLKAKYEAKA